MKQTVVVVVEDEPDTADLLIRTLEREGLSIVHAKDGRQATTLIETIAPPSLVLLDMVIPYVSGFELLGIIRRHPNWQQVPILMVSADYYEPDIQRALQEGATAYIVKSRGFSDLLRAMKQILPQTEAASSAPVMLGAKSNVETRRKKQVARRAHARSSRRKNRAA
ncbi:MAG TPA: response regulator [Nitrospira sp.]|nr:response regulator [Nitrospira sp.]